MIIDNLNNMSACYELDDNLNKGLAFLKESDLAGLPLGRHEIQGDDCYALVMEYDTKPPVEQSWEAHRKYIDIQYVVSGKERIGYANVNSLKVIADYDESTDGLLLQGDGDYLTIAPGTVVVLYPEDAHMPGVQASDGAERVRKAVVKVRLPELLSTR